MNRLRKIFMILFVLVTTISYSQTETKTFNVISQGTLSVVDIVKCEKAIKKADLESYRNKTTRTTIEFDNGLKIEMLSAQELFILGVNLNPSNYVDERDKRFTFPTFHVTEDGYLIALYKHIGK